MKPVPLLLPLCCAAAFSLSMAPTPASADRVIREAEGLLQDLRFEESRLTATKALRRGKGRPADVVEIYMILGQVAASLGESEDAIGFFQNALSVDDEADLPPGASPKLVQPYDDAKSRLDGAEPIFIEYESKSNGQIYVSAGSDPANLVGGAMLRYTRAGRERTKKERGRGTIKLKVPAGATNLQVAALDRYGNQLTDALKVERVVSSVATPVKPSTPSVSGPALHERWQLYAGLGVASILGGTYFGFKSNGYVADAEALDDGSAYTESKALEDKAKSQALYANISFVLGAALGGTAYWFYSSNSSSSSSSDDSKSTLLVPIVSPNEIGLAAHIRF